MHSFKLLLIILIATSFLSSCFYKTTKPKQLNCIVAKQECYPTQWHGVPEDTSKTIGPDKPYYIKINEVNGLNTGSHEYGISHISDNDYILFSKNDVTELNFANALTVENFVTAEKYDEITLPRAGAVTIRKDKIILAQSSNAKLGTRFTLTNANESIGNSRLYEGTIDYKNISNLRKIEFDFNDSNRAWLSQPALSPHGDFLFLVSNKDMRLRGTDIFYSVNQDGKWTEPLNCGDVINTDCDELCPFISNDGRYLYFSSNGRDNIGGYDLFRIVLPLNFFEMLKSNPEAAFNNLPNATNLGSPVNSVYDELFPTSPANPDSILYFSSDRNGVAGSSISLNGGFDIFVRRILTPDNYAFERKEKDDLNLKEDKFSEEELDLKTPVFNVSEEKLKKQFPRRKIPVIDFTLYKLKGSVKRSVDSTPVSGADVIATNKDKDEVYASTKTDESGKYELYLEKNKDYRITAQGDKDFYDTYDIKIDTNDTKEVFVRDFKVARQQTIRINFKYDTWDNPYEYTLDSLGYETGRRWQEELDMLADNILNSIDKIESVVLTGHTDYVASNNYNIKLGKKRVDFVILELVRRGVPEKILQAYSRGETELLPERKNEDDEHYRKRLRRVTVEKIMKRQK